MYNGALGHQDLGQVATAGRDSVPGSPPPSIFRAYKIRAREKVRKGEGGPGDEARTYCACIYLYLHQRKYEIININSILGRVCNTHSSSENISFWI